MHLTRRVNTGNVAKYRQLKNLIRKTIKLVVDPPPPYIIAKSDTGATSHYFNPEDAHALFNIQLTNTGPRVRLPDKITMVPQLVGRLPLAPPPAATKAHIFLASQNASLLLVDQLCDDVCQAIFNKNSLQVLDIPKKN